jgi:hypothetical protein
VKGQSLFGVRGALVAFACAIGATARAQTGASAGATSQPRLPAGIEAAVNRLADSARARGLPPDALFSKAAEGVLKGADSTRIVEAVRGLMRELGAARSTLGTNASSAELVAAASALHAGVTEAQLAHVGQLAGARSGASGDAGRSSRLVMPLVVLADLVARHVSADVAVSSLETLVARGAPDAQFASLRSAIERDISSGETPDAAMRSRSAAVLRSLDSRPVSRPPEN